MATLKGKVAIVTGGSRGIGAAIAKRLALDGATVILTYAQNADAAEAVVAEIALAKGSATAICAAMEDSDAVSELFTKAMKAYGRIDILVNNAGVAEFLALEKIDRKHYDHILNVNVWGPLFAMQEAARVMGTGGRIINISSGSAQAAPPGVSVYAASKAALDTITRSLSSELGPRGITVNAVSPGITATDMLKENIPSAAQDRMIANTALGRLGMPQDIADVVAFLASDDARWITGQIIGASGGLR